MKLDSRSVFPSFCCSCRSEFLTQRKLRMQVIGINGHFPGPIVEAKTNWNIVVNVENNLDEPFLVTWYEQYSGAFFLVTRNSLHFLQIGN